VSNARRPETAAVSARLRDLLPDPSPEMRSANRVRLLTDEAFSHLLPLYLGDASTDLVGAPTGATTT
jgi:hypothetical protein